MGHPRALLIGSGIHVPDICVDNHMLSRIMDTSDEWIRERSGIVTRYYVEPGVGSADLGAAAAKAALQDAEIEAEEVDYIVCATMTPDHYFPGSGTLIQEKLGIDQRPALDIRQQCAGFAYGLQVVDALIRGGQARTVLLVGTDVHTSLMPFYVPGGGSTHRPWVDAEMIASGDTVPVMDGRQVFKLAVTRMPKVTREVLKKQGYTLEDLDLLIMHQANLRINEAAQRMLKLPAEKVHNNIQKYGNTTSATLPLCFHEARELGKTPEGALVAFTALGAGLHWGSVLMRA
jgi:3-oxoacyl-[acyl-carrier-protein] synthase-3